MVPSVTRKTGIDVLVGSRAGRGTASLTYGGHALARRLGLRTAMRPPELGLRNRLHGPLDCGIEDLPRKLGNGTHARVRRRHAYGTRDANHTGRFIANKRLFSSTSVTSDRRKCLRDGYRMHHTSLGGRCFAAEAMNAAAPSGHTREYALSR